MVQGRARVREQFRPLGDAGGDRGPFDELARRLREAHRRVARLPIDDETKTQVRRRLLALTDAAKRDLSCASQRLDGLLADLDAGRYD